MKRTRIVLLCMSAVVVLWAPAVAQSPRPSRPPTTTASPRSAAGTAAGPRLQPVAETRLLMEGMTQANFLGLEKILKGKEIDAESWTFARGQALLIAEAGNLLLMRPPKNSGENAWMKAASDVRDSASQLARVVATQDVERSRTALINLSNTCNACHESFRVKTRIRAFGESQP